MRSAAQAQSVDAQDVSEIIVLAWCDKTTFDMIYQQTGLSETDITRLMRRALKPRSFHIWRVRVAARCKRQNAHRIIARQDGNEPSKHAQRKLLIRNERTSSRRA